jgi:6-phosphogluconolactonase
MWAYVGSRTTRERNARGEGISIFHVNESTGDLTPTDVVGGLLNPSFQAYSDRHQVLYSIHGDSQEVSAFRVHTETGALTFLNQVSCEGRNPVHLALDPSHQRLVISNHLTSAMAVLSILDDGRLGQVTQLVPLVGEPGPHRKEQPFSKPHSNPFDRSGRFVIVPDKGLDRIFVFRFENGQLTPARTPSVASRETSGPRHVAFHPSGPWLYCVNELDSTVTAYRFNGDSGELTPFQVLSTLSERFTGNSRASEIEVHAGGRWLYASNRGEDSVAVFEIDQISGVLRLAQTVPTLGRTPRFFTLHPSGRWLYVLNEDSDTIVRFRVDERSGLLATVGDPLHCASPVCMSFLG